METYTYEGEIINYREESGVGLDGGREAENRLYMPSTDTTWNSIGIFIIHSQRALAISLRKGNKMDIIIALPVGF